MKKSVKPASKLPAGFKAISGGGDSWKPEKKGASINGVMGTVKVVHMPKKGKQPARDVNVHTIKTKEGDIQVWQSAGLKALEKVKKGKPVYVEFTGKRVIKKGQAPMREYVVATK